MAVELDGPKIEALQPFRRCVRLPYSGTFLFHRIGLCDGNHSRFSGLLTTRNLHQFRYNHFRLLAQGWKIIRGMDRMLGHFDPISRAEKSCRLKDY